MGVGFMYHARLGVEAEVADAHSANALKRRYSSDSLCAGRVAPSASVRPRVHHEPERSLLLVGRFVSSSLQVPELQLCSERNSPWGGALAACINSAGPSRLTGPSQPGRSTLI